MISSAAQFSTMLLDLLNGTQGVGPYNPSSSPTLQLVKHLPPGAGQNSPSGYTTDTVSSDEVALNVGSIDASDAANSIVDAVGSNGQLTLSDVNKLLGLGGPSDLSLGSPYSPDAAIARDWAMLTGSSTGTVSASELSSLIQNYQQTWYSAGGSACSTSQ
ncbi:MAG TPA: hypothetical protein VHC22_23020 [Pirellulales bacterium]|nr:hypothetical protein [Pirellulales bacterium]